MRSLHLFAGAGGGLLGDLILGHTPVGAVEINPYCCDVLRARRDDGWFPVLRVHEQDIRLFDPSEYAGQVDIVAGGFPCQDISAAGKGAGITGERSGLWNEFARIVGVVRPRFVFVENSPMLSRRGLHVVLGDLAALGFDAEWAVVSAAQAGAPHRRERIWILANAESGGLQSSRRSSHAALQRTHGAQDVDDGSPEVANANGTGLEIGQGQPGDDGAQQPSAIGAGWWATEPGFCRVAHGVAHRVHRLKALGNGQVPLQAALAWRILSDAIHA